MGIERIRKLPTHSEVRERWPVSTAMAETILSRRKEIENIFTGRNDRILLIIGPCSADYEESVMDYLLRLAKVQERVKDKILIVPRLYTSKPRTTGKGYKGMFHQPDPKAAPDIAQGIVEMRKLHLRAINETGFISADELLYPQNYGYLDDMLGYVAIGARSVEDQEHRLIVSGIDVPTGMKNPTCGDLSIMINSLIAGQSEHDFMYDGWECRTTGNALAHSILRGFADESGNVYSNYHFENILHLHQLYAQNPDLKNPAVIVDCNHSNSHKRPEDQPRIARETLKYREYNRELKAFIKGFMVESYLEDGKQSADESVYGKSITDACLGWNNTERMIFDMADSC